MSLTKSYIVPHPPLIIPGIGNGEEKKIENTVRAYQKISEEILSIKPDTIIISSPHSKSYYDYIQISSGEYGEGSFKEFGADLSIKCQYDQQFIEKLNLLLEKNSFPAGTEGLQQTALDHGTMIPLFFIKQKYQNFKLVRISISGLALKTHFQLGELINQVISESDKKYVYIASGDLSHKLKSTGPYGYAKEGVEFDNKIVSIIKDNKLKDLLKFEEGFCNKAAECGLKSFVIMAGVLNNYNISSELLSYEGPFGVGYAVASFLNNHDLEIKKSGKEEKKKEEDEYVGLAKKSLEYYFKNQKKYSDFSNVPKIMKDSKAGVFVSLHKYGQLRGCIGTIQPVTSSIASEIVQNAVSAAVRDPRFSPVVFSELPFLEISVDVLTKPELVKSIDELDPLIYGVIVSCNNRSGVLLPDLEGIDSVEQQINIALQKAGISSEDNYEIKKFKVFRHT
ncbi:MAG: AmmeMemoRadiSam system protein A [Candidatus Izemoplasmatales bacterium]